jgi:hypothetical protein
MFFCEDCRAKNNWPDGLIQQERCEKCGKNKLCYDVPSVMLIPEQDRTIEQTTILKMVMDSYRDRAEQIVITSLDGRQDHRMTEMVRKVFSYRNKEVDWYATYQARLTVQERYQQTERAIRDRR